jgi:hypothetical protein
MVGSSRNPWPRIPLPIIGAACVGAVACDWAEAKPPEHARIKGGCEPLLVPEHAYVNAYGNGWICERGFERDGSSCKLS